LKATVTRLGALVLAGLCTSAAHAQGYAPYYHYIGPPRPPAPDACGPGFYAPNVCGCPFGPNYCLRPYWDPFNGLRPNFAQAPGEPGVPAQGQLGCPPPQVPGRAPAYPGAFAPAPGALPGAPPGSPPGAPPGAPPAAPRGAPPQVAGLPPVHTLPHLPGYSPPGCPPPAPAAPSFPTHPFARSPRDFFMWSETYEDELMRQRLPVVVP
jgi:hypothetical protein